MTDRSFQSSFTLMQRSLISINSMSTGILISNPLNMVYGYQQMNVPFGSNGIIEALRRIYRESSFKALFSGWFINLNKSIIEIIVTNQCSRLLKGGYDDSLEGYSIFELVKQTIIYTLPSIVAYPLDVIYVRRTQLFRENIGFFSLLFRILKTDGIFSLYRGLSYDISSKLFITAINFIMNPFLSLLIADSNLSPSVFNVLHQFVLRIAIQPFSSMKYQIQGQSKIVPEDLQPKISSLKEIVMDLSAWNGSLTLFYWTFLKVQGMRIGRGLSTGFFRWYNTDDGDAMTPIQRVLQRTTIEELRERQLNAPKYSIPYYTGNAKSV